MYNQKASNYQYQENNEKPLPQIRQTLFIVDKKRQYLFDVNQNITIKKLKRMIVAAADLNKLGLRIFHDDVEYTKYDDSCLDELFPNLQKVVFYIQYSYDQVEDLEEIIDLKLKQYCNLHNGKYPYFYCFTCGRSICSDCLRSGEHNNHETKEKYDYLQESRNLVELLFKDLKDMFKNAKGVNDDSVEELKAMVSIQFFPKLIEMIKQIEQKMINLILFFLEKEKGNFKTIENNVNLLKNHCEEGLDKLKKEIVIEDLMIDENVFLTFDSKFKEIGKEKEKFRDDIEKYKRFSENLYLIKSIIEKTYKEIYDFLLKYLNVTEFEDIKNQLNSQNISVIDKKRILEKLLSNIKRRPSSEAKYDTYRNTNVNTNVYNLRSRDVPKTEEFNIDDNKNKNVNYVLSSTQKDIKGKGSQSNIFNVNNIGNNSNNYSNFNTNDYNNKNNTNTYLFSSNMNNYNENNNNNFKGQNEDGNISNNNIYLKETKKTFLGPNPNISENNFNYSAEYNYSSNYNNTGGINNNNYYNSKNNNQQNKNVKTEIIEKRHIYENNMEEEDEDSSKGQIYHVVGNIIPSKNEVVLYNVDLDAISRRKIEFSKLTGIIHFFEECAWVNHNNKLYILGGIDDFGQSTKIFLEYDPIKNIIKRLPDSKYTHSRHSIFAYDNQIFVVGGDRLECEKYNIVNNEWSSMPSLSFKQIYPVLYVHNDILYSFFGIDENAKKTDNAQKLNLNNNRSKWSKLTYKRNGCNLCVFGCGVAKTSENCVLFLGGMDDNGIRQEAIQFDFSNFTATKTDFMLEEKAYFKDSVLLKLSPKNYGNFSIDDTNSFLKIRFKVNEN